MNSKKYSTIFIMIFLLGGIFAAVQQRSQYDIRDSASISKKESGIASTTANPLLQNKSKTNGFNNSEIPRAEPGKSLEISPILFDRIPVTLGIGSSSYSFQVPTGYTVYETMVVLASTTPFTFESKFYSGLGYFIEKINDKKNAGGYYWTLYVNGKYSNAGASQLKLSAGDKVEWKYEKR